MGGEGEGMATLMQIPGSAPGLRVGRIGRAAPSEQVVVVVVVAVVHLYSASHVPRKINK